MATKKPAAKTATTAVATRKSSTALVDVKAALAAQVAGLASRTAPATGANIRVTQDKKFKFPDGTETGGPFKGVIIDFVATREYYEGVFDKDNIEPPGCFAISAEPKGMVPSDNSPAKQAPACDACPQNQWGSDGKKGKACKEGRKMVVLPPDSDQDHPLWTLKISPTAIKPFDGYVNQVARQFGLPPVGVVSEIGFDPANTYATVRFGNPEENENVAADFDRQAEAKDTLMVEPDVSNYGQTAPAPVRGKAPARKTAPTRR